MKITYENGCIISVHDPKNLSAVPAGLTNFTKRNKSRLENRNDLTPGPLSCATESMNG